MKKYRTLLSVFLVIWVVATGFICLLGQILDRVVFQDWKYNVLLGFAIAFSGIIAPILTDRVKKIFMK